MIDIVYIRSNPDEVKRGIAKKGINPKLVDDFLAADKEWREETKQTEELRAQLNKLSKERKVDEAREVKKKLKEKEMIRKAVDEKRLNFLKQIPNLPLPGVPEGDESANQVLREEGKKPRFDFQPKDYLYLAQKLGIIDIERAAKVSGTRFGYLLGDAVRLEFALIQFALKKLSRRGFIPVIPPVLIKRKAMEGMGYLERGENEIYKTQDDLYLVGTSEQSIGPMHMNETFKETDLPKRYVAFSTCFRREAGSYGKDTKGILRVHQFDKLEMFSYTVPEKSKEEHEFLLKLQEELMQDLKLPYRVINIAAGDLGDPAAAKYDIEAWLPGQAGGRGEYRETHSTSNTTDYQARRLNIKFKPATNDPRSKTRYVHMLNGTALAIGRILIAIIENYQTKNETVIVPKVLRKYAGIKIIK